MLELGVAPFPWRSPGRHLPEVPLREAADLAEGLQRVPDAPLSQQEEAHLLRYPREEHLWAPSQEPLEEWQHL